MSLYDDLGVAPDATTDEIKAAHRRAARQHHPDAGGDREAFDRIQRAAVILRDPEKRARYDETGEADDQPDRSMAAVIDVLCQAFTNVLGTYDYEHSDLIAATKDHLRQLLASVKAQRGDLAKAAKEFERAIDRLGHKGDRPNAIGAILDVRLASARAGEADLATKQGYVEQALEFADDYTWRFDAPQPADEIVWQVIPNWGWK